MPQVYGTRALALKVGGPSGAQGKCCKLSEQHRAVRRGEFFALRRSWVAAGDAQNVRIDGPRHVLAHGDPARAAALNGADDGWAGPVGAGGEQGVEVGRVGQR